jgi:hypothetical protein
MTSTLLKELTRALPIPGKGMSRSLENMTNPQALFDICVSPLFARPTENCSCRLRMKPTDDGDQRYDRPDKADRSGDGLVWTFADKFFFQLADPLQFKVKGNGTEWIVNATVTDIVGGDVRREFASEGNSKSDVIRLLISCRRSARDCDLFLLGQIVSDPQKRFPENDLFIETPVERWQMESV